MLVIRISYSKLVLVAVETKEVAVKKKGAICRNSLSSSHYQPNGSALKPLLLTIFTTCSSVTSPWTVRILSALSVSTFQLAAPAAWSKSACTLDTQPPQL